MSKSWKNAVQGAARQRRELGRLAAAGAVTIGLLWGAVPPSQAATASETVANWPAASQKAAKTMMGKYGQPDEVTQSMVVWHNNGPWKRTIVYRTPVPHHFPMPHPDVLEQFIDYRVPASKFDDLAMYDGSVIAERTKGEISARCDKEEANILALNLAHDIVTGKRSVASARAFYGRAMMMMKNGMMHPYVMKLQFQPGTYTNQPDKPLMTPAQMRAMERKLMKRQNS